MKKEATRNSAFRSTDDVGEAFSRWGQDRIEALSLPVPINDSEVLCEVIEQSHAHRIAISSLSIADPALVGTSGLLSGLQKFYRPNDDSFLQWMPLHFLHLHISVGRRGNCQALNQALRRQANAFRILKDGFYVGLRAQLSFSHIDTAGLESISEELINAGFDVVEWMFEFPDPASVDLTSMQRSLTEFGRSGIARHPRLRITNLPFCFLPAKNMRSHYRGLQDKLQGHALLFQQRALIRELKYSDYPFLPPCQQCRRKAACYALTEIGEHPDYLAYVKPSVESTIAFVGASLQEGDRQNLESQDILFTTPAEQGDMFVAILENFETILLIDGYFFERYALTTFEVLIALLENRNVFGSSSLGALRALELANYGMRGVGYTFRFLSSCSIVPYHVVAQTYDQFDRPITVPLIAVFRFLELAENCGIVTRAERHHLYYRADQLHFTELTFRRVLIEWKAALADSPLTFEALQAFHCQCDPLDLDVKRCDALELLQSFRSHILRDGIDFSARTVASARARYMEILRARFPKGPDKSLPDSWTVEGHPAHFGGRSRSSSATVKLAKKFFEGLDVTVAETSRLDQTEFAMVNVVFVPFFFLEYGNSAGSGYGSNLDDALAAAYCEVLERIPCGTLQDCFAEWEDIAEICVPFNQLPFYQSLSEDSGQLFLGDDGALLDRDYLKCSELITGQITALPKNGARLPNSCGMAAGNNLLEAILYGLYEVVEHDVYACYETKALIQHLRHLHLDSDVIEDAALRSLIGDVRSKGHDVHLFNLLNPYQIPTILTLFHEADRGLIFSGQCSRLNVQEAIAHSFHEALNGHYISYFGSRDDWRGFEQQSQASPRHLINKVSGGRSLCLDYELVDSDFGENLRSLVRNLQSAGRDQIFVLDLSPCHRFDLSVAKVIVPGMNFRTAARRAPTFYKNCLATHRLLKQHPSIGQEIDTIEQSDVLVQEAYAKPLHRFFKS